MSLFFRKSFSKLQLLQPFIRKASSTVETIVNPEAAQPPSPLESGTASKYTYEPDVEPIISTRSYLDENKFYLKPRQLWLENIDTVEEKKLGLVTLHPEIFGALPRIDIIHENIRWQRLYRFVSYAHTKTRAEVRGGGRKPWPQKGLGRARHGSIRSPLWRKGGVAHGPRSPTPYYYMLPFYMRILGLRCTLSVKLAQDDMHIVQDLELPTDDPEFIIELAKQRNWGPSVLFIDSSDVMPQNMALAVDTIKHFNLMPFYGLNVYSMLKHDTLVLTLSAVRLIEDKLLYHLNRIDPLKIKNK